MKEFLLIVRTEGEIWTLLSPDKLQKHIEHGTAYIDKLAKQGKIKSAQPLDAGSRIVAKTDGLIKDAPFNETKEVIAGYFLVVAESLEEAVAIAKENPIFEDIPTKIEVHPIKQIPTST
jgi:hypothetical protein